MRSLTFTFILAVLAAIVCGVLGWHARSGNLNAIFGVPPVQPGQKLYHDFRFSDVARISVSAHGVTADYTKAEDGWKSSTPPHDRMDPRHAVDIIAFTLNLNVQDYARMDDVDQDEIGVREGSISIRLEDAAGKPLARYRMGDRTPLSSENKQGDLPHPTVYVQARDSGRRDYVYACTGDISPLFTDGLKHLRDHRPFYFDPRLVQKVRIRGDQGELTLGHEKPEDPWRIVKPLDLRTDGAAMKALLGGLFELKAPKISDRSAITLPGTETVKPLQIGLTNFGTEAEVLLEIYPPENAEARERLATVSNRPDTVFHLPIKPEQGYVSLSDLPVNVNDLRDRSLTRLDIASLRAVSLSPATGRRILISRQPPKPWEVQIGNVTYQANEKRLFDLLKALTEGRATAFETDAATDLTQWGLAQPFLIVELLGADNQTIRLNFGMDGHGGVFMNRQGTSTVVRIDPALVGSFAINPTDWRHSRLWSVSMVDLVAIDRVVRSGPALTLFYSFNTEGWTAQLDGKEIIEKRNTVDGQELIERTEVSSLVDPAKANRLLDSLVNLNVTRWLPATDPDAAAALAVPLLEINVTQRTVNDMGDTTGLEGRTLTISPSPAGPNVFYGRLTDEPNPFIIDRETFLKIALDPLETQP